MRILGREPDSKVVYAAFMLSSAPSFARCIKFATLLLVATCSKPPAHCQTPVTATVHPGAAGERLVWSDEFDQPDADPDPTKWTYETGGGGWGNGELETYCSPRTTDPPCDPAQRPNSFIGKDGLLHIVARRNAAGQWTSARLVTHDLQSFGYGRFEARIRIPRGEGVWPAFWALGDDIQQHPWPACGELDIMENVGKEPSIVHGTLHGPGYQGLGIGKPFTDPGGVPFADTFHVFGMIWAPDKVQFYVDDPARPYATFTPGNLPRGATWPFRDRKIFLVLNLAMGGQWPGPPNESTSAQPEMLVDYVRVYQPVAASPLHR